MIVKGYELLKMAYDEELEENTILQVTTLPIKFFYDGNTFWVYEDNKKVEEMCATALLEREFEILKKDENKNIEEYETIYKERFIDKEVRNKLNEVIRAVNKLNEKRN